MYDPEVINIYKDILKSSHRSKAFIFSIISSLLATIGLATNSVTILIGSMLLSPIGSLITKNIIYSFLKENTNLDVDVKYKSWITQLIMVLLITLTLSYLTGKLLQKIKNPYTGKYLSDSWPTHEMKERAKIFNAIYMIFIAILCGIALPIALVRNSEVNLVGIGIATALIPPIANIGLSLSMNKKTEEVKEYKKTAIITGISIFVINLILLWLPSKFLIKEISKKNSMIKYIEWIFINPNFIYRYNDYKEFLKLDKNYDGRVSYSEYLKYNKSNKLVKDFFKKNKNLTLKDFLNLKDKLKK